MQDKKGAFKIPTINADDDTVCAVPKRVYDYIYS